MRKAKVAAILILITGAAALLCLRIEREQNLKVVEKTPRTFSEIEEVNCKAVKPVVYRRVPCLAKLPPKDRKRTFINILLPALLVENYRIGKLRTRLISIKKKMEGNKKLSPQEKALLKDLSKKYRASTIEELLYKVAPIPPGLAIAQAAIESGWGSSRFFCEANNLFGEWSFSNRGIKAKNSKVLLKTFPSILASVRSYYHNLNTGWAYEGFRIARMKNPESLHLVKHLERYSILGKEYVKRLERVIKENHLDTYDHCRIDPSYIDNEWHLSIKCLGN